MRRDPGPHLLKLKHQGLPNAPRGTGETLRPYVCVFSPSSRSRLTDRDLDRFPDRTLFHRVARAVCHAGCLPRKELYEAWEMARRVRRLFRGGRIVDLGAGHGLLSQIMLLLDDTSAGALAVDKTLPASCAKLHDVLVQTWPRLAGRVTFVVTETGAQRNVKSVVSRTERSHFVRRTASWSWYPSSPSMR